MNKPKVMYVLRQYPQISETYVQTEIDAVSSEYEVIVIAFQQSGKNGTSTYKQHNPYLVINDVEQIDNAVRLFKPDILHTHWAISMPFLHKLARKFGIPFTVRAHSFDAMFGVDERLSEWRKAAKEVISNAVSDELCLGVVAFPFTRPFLETNGALPEKIIDCFPCVDFNRFYDRSPNGDKIMNVGACLPKKRMEDFLELGLRLPDKEFNLYPVSYDVANIAQKNQTMGSPVRIHSPIEPSSMPAEYKKHQWLVYTADRLINTVGWPMAAAEAQASGVGVLLPDLRPDMKDYIGDAGYIYQSLDEVVEIISEPVPEHIREAGFENARKSDIYDHKTLLTDLWKNSIH